MTRWVGAVSVVSGRFMATVTGRALGDHVCWPFHGMDEFVSAARDYVTEGLDRHERVAFCKVAITGMHRAVVSEVTQVGRSVSSDVPVLTPMTTELGWTPSTSPIGPFRRMTEAALADGYTGLRILTDATDIARDPEMREQWFRCEHLIDRYGLRNPVVVVCGYDIQRLGEEVVAEMASVHAHTGGTPCSFLLRATDEDGGLALSGEVDRGSAAGLFQALLAIAGDTAGPVVLDLSEHAFIDHTGLDALDRAARTLGTTVSLVGASPLTALLVDAFGFTGITVQAGS